MVEVHSYWLRQGLYCTGLFLYVVIWCNVVFPLKNTTSICLGAMSALESMLCLQTQYHDSDDDMAVDTAADDDDDDAMGFEEDASSEDEDERLARQLDAELNGLRARPARRVWWDN
jgi:hypothetical protein